MELHLRRLPGGQGCCVPQSRVARGRGRALKLSSGLTLDSLASSEFQNVMRFDARDSSLTDEDLRRLGQGLLPSLTSLDASGCQNMTSVGVKALVKGLGARLKEFSQDSTPRHSMCK